MRCLGPQVTRSSPGQGRRAGLEAPLAALSLADAAAGCTHRLHDAPGDAAPAQCGSGLDAWNDPLHDVPRVFVERFCSSHIPNKSPCIDHISNSANNQLTKVTSLYCWNGVCPLMYPTKAHNAWLTWTSRSPFFSRGLPTPQTRSMFATTSVSLVTLAQEA